MDSEAQTLNSASKSVWKKLRGALGSSRRHCGDPPQFTLELLSASGGSILALIDATRRCN
ncbi:MAG: hypothetical protein ACO2PM_14750 [Pyrobaculum sp.]|jgi:hypothetical protein